MKPSLCLGTAQLGSKYGITNRVGEINGELARQIVELAYHSGIHYIDTAKAYGSAEEIIGDITKGKKDIKLISKLSTNKEKSSLKDLIPLWESNIRQSLDRLNIKKLDTYLVHTPGDLNGNKGKFLKEWLVSTKERGLTRKIGVSIYSSDDLDDSLVETLDVIQLPLSLYDQRLIQEGVIKELKAKGIEIHVRSIFLQGLLLQTSKKWPDKISKSFREHHSKLEELVEKEGVKLMDASLDFIKGLRGIDVVLVGVTKPSELAEILRAWNKKERMLQMEKESIVWAWENHTELDPRNWKI